MKTLVTVFMSMKLGFYCVCCVKCGDTALILAVTKGTETVAIMLIENGANLDVVNKVKLTFFTIL